MSTVISPRCHCRRHAVTNLRCARCETPICPDCSVVGPVGMLCHECGSNKKSPLFQISVGQLALAYAVCLTVGIVSGWIFQSVAGRFGFFALWGVFLYGIGIAELALRLTGRKRGPKIEILAGSCAVLGLLGGGILALLPHILAQPQLLTLFFLNPWSYLEIGIAVYAAVRRVRYL